MKKTEEYIKIFEEMVLSNTIHCPVCRYPSKSLSNGNIYNFRCRNKLVRHSFNVLKNTPFKNSYSRIAMKLQIYDCWLEGISTKNISWIMNINEKIIWRALKNLGKYIIPKLYSDQEMIGGPNIIVEIDESKFGKVKYNRGHRVDGVWVLGMIERTEKRIIILVPVHDRKKETLMFLIKKYIHPDSTIYTDCFKSYNALNEEFHLHQTVNHSHWFVDPISGVHTNSIEGNWCTVKANTPIRKRTRKSITLELVRFMLKRSCETKVLETLLKYLF